MSIRLTAVLALVLLGWLGLPASASANVRCRVGSATDMDFGRPGTPVGPVATTATVMVRCNGNKKDAGEQVLVCVSVLPGARSPRQMTRNGGNDTLGYEIYSDAAHSRILNLRNVLATTLVIGPDGDRVSASFTLHGQLEPSGAAPAAGRYRGQVDGGMVWATGPGASCSNGASWSGYELFAFEARARLDGSCTIVANDLDFGTHSGLPADVERSTTIDIACTRDTAYRVRLDGGTTSGNIADRRMRHASGPETIDYNLYLDDTRLRLWGNGAVGEVAQGTGDGLRRLQTLTVYGRVPTQAPVRVGGYSDTVTATVEY